MGDGLFLPPGTAVRVTPTTSYSPRTGNITVDNSW